MRDDNVVPLPADPRLQERAAWATSPTDAELERVLRADPPLPPPRRTRAFALAGLGLGVGGVAMAMVGRALSGSAPATVALPEVHPPEPAARVAPIPTVVEEPTAAPFAPPPARSPTPPRPSPDVVAFAGLLDQLDDVQDPAEVVRRIDGFTEAFPGSRFEAEAGALRLGARARSAAPEAALREAEAWLAAWPTDGRRLEVHALAGRVARDGLHDCARALPHDRAVAAGGVEPARTIAATWAGLCAVATGDEARGKRELGAVDPSALPPALARARADALGRR